MAAAASVRLELVAKFEHQTMGVAISEGGRTKDSPIPSAELIDDTIETTVQDERLRWPDNFVQGPDGSIQVTSSHIVNNNRFNREAGPVTAAEPWRIVEDRKG